MEGLETSIVPSTGMTMVINDKRALSVYRSPEITKAWYTDADDATTFDPAREAYREAVALFKRELTHDECKKIWLEDKVSMNDVQLAIVHAQAEYEKSSKSSKVKIWLVRCSTRIIYYGNILDVLVQQSPEYVSLIWGGMKFLFMAVLNHEELLIEISKAISRIADVLPRAELHLVLYPTKRMKETVALLYAKIIKFVQSAISYYKRSRLSKSITAILKPFALSFKEILEEIAECSKRAEELANSASKAELRDLRIEAQNLRSEVRELRFQVREMAAAQYTFQNQVLLDLGNQRQNYERFQLEKIHTLPMIGQLPSCQQSLEYCRSMTRRRKARLQFSLPSRSVSMVNHWGTSEDSSMLIGEARGIKTSSRNFAVDVLDAILEADIPAAWVLPSSFGEDDVTLKNVMLELMVQIIAMNPSVLSNGINPVSARHFKAATTIDDLFTILQRCLRGLGRLFIIIDLILISKVLQKDSSLEIEEFVGKICDMTSSSKTILKIIVLTSRSDASLSSLSQEASGVTVIATDPGARKLQLMRRPKYRAAFASRNQRLDVKDWKTNDLETG